MLFSILAASATINPLQYVFMFLFLSASRAFGVTTSPLLRPLPSQGLAHITMNEMLVHQFRAFRPSPFGVSSRETKYSTSIFCRNSSGVVPVRVRKPIVQVRNPAAVIRTVVQVAGAKNGCHCAVSPYLFCHRPAKPANNRGDPLLLSQFTPGVMLPLCVRNAHRQKDERRSTRTSPKAQRPGTQAGGRQAYRRTGRRSQEPLAGRRQRFRGSLYKARQHNQCWKLLQPQLDNVLLDHQLNTPVC